MFQLVRRVGNFFTGVCDSPGLPFTVVLIQFVDNCNFITITVWLFYTHFHSLLAGAMGNTPPIWVDGVGDIFDVIFYWWILYIYVWDPDRDFAPLIKDYTSSSLLGSYLHVFLTDPLPLEFLPRVEELYEPLSRLGRGESDWTGLRS